MESDGFLIWDVLDVKVCVKLRGVRSESDIGLRSDSAWSLSISEGPETEKEKL